MKKLVIFLATLILLTGFLTGCSNTENKTSQKIEDIPILGSHIVYDYENLKETAQVVAKVEVEDTLTEKNSSAIYEEKNDPTSINVFYALRKVKVVEYYKNSLHLDSKELTVLEEAPHCMRQCCCGIGRSAFKKQSLLRCHSKNSC